MISPRRDKSLLDICTEFSVGFKTTTTTSLKPRAPEGCISEQEDHPVLSKVYLQS